MGILSDNNQQTGASNDKYVRLAGQIQALKSKNRNLMHENENLRNSRPTRVNMSLQGSTLTFSESMQQNGKQWNCIRTVEFESALKTLLPLIRPLMNISRAAALGNDVERHTQRHIVDSNGRITKELDRDGEGHVINMPNDHDKANAVLNVLASDPSTCKALLQIGEKLRDSKEQIAQLANQYANSESLLQEQDDDFDLDL